jgi:hypothetical protein
LQDYPDYGTQGKTLDDLKEHLKDLYHDVTSGAIPGIRRVEELTNNGPRLRVLISDQKNAGKMARCP